MEWRTQTSLHRDERCLGPTIILLKVLSDGGHPAAVGRPSCRSSVAGSLEIATGASCSGGIPNYHHLCTPSPATKKDFPYFWRRVVCPCCLAVDRKAFAFLETLLCPRHDVRTRNAHRRTTLVPQAERERPKRPRWFGKT